MTFRVSKRSLIPATFWILTSVSCSSPLIPYTYFDAFYELNLQLLGNSRFLPGTSPDSESRVLISGCLHFMKDGSFRQTYQIQDKQFGKPAVVTPMVEVWPYHIAGGDIVIRDMSGGIGEVGDEFPVGKAEGNDVLLRIELKTIGTRSLPFARLSDRNCSE